MRVDELVDFVALVGGVASSSQLKSAGFSAGLIAHASEGGRIERLTRGVYCTPDVFDDDFLVISARWKRVFSPMPAPCISMDCRIVCLSHSP